MRGTGGSKERGRGESKFAEKRKKRKTVFSVTPAAGPIDSDWINFTLLLPISLCHSLPQSLSVILFIFQFQKVALHMHFIYLKVQLKRAFKEFRMTFKKHLD